MASFTDSSKMGEVHTRICTRLFRFRTGNCVPSTDYRAALKSSLQSEGAEELVDQLCQARHGLISSCLSTSEENQLKSVDNYLPSLIQLMESFKLDEGGAKLDRPLVFEWHGGFGDIGPPFKSTDINYELLMLYHLKAMLHNKLAATLLDADCVSFLSEAGKNLLIASSLMDLLSNKLAAMDQKRFSSKSPNPPELQREICVSMAALFKGSAQMMSVTKAITGPAAPPATVVSRLCVGVVNSMTTAMDSLREGSRTPPPFHSRLLTHMHANRQLYSALAHQYHAQSFMEKTEMGKCIGCCLAAKALLKEQSGSVQVPWEAEGLPRAVSAEFAPAVNLLISRIDQIQEKADRDNRFIYFQHVPSAKDAPELPPEASIMNPVPFTEPTPVRPAVRFVFVQKPTFLGSLFGQKPAATSTSATTTTASEPSSEAGDIASTAGVNDDTIPSAPPPPSPAPFPYHPPALNAATAAHHPTQSPQAGQSNSTDPGQGFNSWV